ncbi:MAG: hypothetical protein GOMPHAMPRED_004173 [Gomphillus americanus]|uniref:ATPase inhibitor, mitochondrial n=1 Tax=Gomphillus americanus TaxID=1940652 RepID=A0A8H3FNK3_9LECA|nr:MAG: hypothetical protein GOMPHAMPRED_004173 [Gomphillus americanus]
MRQAIISATRPALRSSLYTQTRSFTVFTSRMAEGDTGGLRSGGTASGDAFSKREKASEDYAIKAREREKLLALKQKIADQQKHLKDLSDHLDELSKESGGEHH